jgi:8-oxo-dGTP pyrophosphatase MutT (NUDIX family)
MCSSEIIAPLSSFLEEGPLPGGRAHRRLAPRRRAGHEDRSGRAMFGFPTHSWAAVLILLYPEAPDDRLHLPLILRPDDDTPHAAQIGLPGGRHEDEERYPTQTALRECREELGVADETVRPLGFLTPLYIAVSDVTVTPVVGFVPGRPVLSPAPAEVERCFSVPVEQFLRGALVGEFDVRGTVIQAPFYDTDAGRVWGATAMIMAEFVEILLNLQKS